MKKAQTLNTKLALCKEKIEQVILEQSKKLLSMIALFKEIFILINKLYHYVSLQFNMEETAFEWELTNYPLMQATVDKLNPFLNLYETSMEFMNKQKTWFESPMGTHDPKVIIKE